MARTRFAVIVAASGLLLVAGLLTLANGAEGKKKGKRGGSSAAVVTSTKQSEILAAGQITIRGGNGKVTVRGASGGSVVGPLTSTASGKPGKAKTLALTDEGKSLLNGCSLDSLDALTVKKGKKRKGKKRKKSSRTTSVSLTEDLGACSVPSENPASKPYVGPAIDTSNADRCDFLDPTVCQQPWPNDYFTVADPTTDTGRRLALNVNSMPRNRFNVPIDPTDMNRADGFSPGNEIIIKIPGVQTQAAFNNSNMVGVTNLHKYDDDGQAVVVINTDTGERHPVFAELDANTPNPDETNLIIRPSRNWDEGGHYIVALRNLRNASNQAVEPPLPFRVYRDRLTTTQAAVENRRPAMETIMSSLQDAGVARSNLYLAWDFTVASEYSLSHRALQIRDDALERLGDTDLDDGIAQGVAPAFHITSTVQNPNADTRREVNGVLDDVPCYLNFDGCPTYTEFNFEPDGDVAFNPAFTMDVPFRCLIPNSVVQGGAIEPSKPGTYGHGLLGSYTQVNGQSALGNQSNSSWCAVDWVGFASQDEPSVAAAMIDLSDFNRLVDRMQQGFVNFMYLGRAMMLADGFNSDPAFQIDPDGGGAEPDTPVLRNTNELYFEGISQGAIMGGALTAVNPDFTSAVLNVPGMNYSTLLRRSVDTSEQVDRESVGLYNNYTSLRLRPLILSQMQLLWDRGEANGYAHHMTTDPLPDTPEHKVLLQLAYGDHQVSNLSAEVEARTIGAELHTPSLDPGRHWEGHPYLQLPAIDDYPYDGSAIVYYDGGPLGFDGTSDCTNEDSTPQHGTAPAPTVNLPPKPNSIYGCDPHGYPRRAVDGLAHVSSFLQPNGFIDQCQTGLVARPCYANGYAGP